MEYLVKYKYKYVVPCFHLGSRCPTRLCCLRFISERDPSNYFVEAEKNQKVICYVVVKRIIVVSHVVLGQSLIQAYIDRLEFLLILKYLFMSCKLLLQQRYNIGVMFTKGTEVILYVFPLVYFPLLNLLILNRFSLISVKSFA